MFLSWRWSCEKGMVIFEDIADKYPDKKKRPLMGGLFLDYSGHFFLCFSTSSSNWFLFFSTKALSLAFVAAGSCFCKSSFSSLSLST